MEYGLFLLLSWAGIGGIERLETFPNHRECIEVAKQLSKEDKEKYQRLLREGRIDLTKQGVYDPGMMRVLKKARCTVERTNFECSLGGE